MKKNIRLFALLMTVVMMAATLSSVLAEDAAPAAGDPILATVNGYNVPLSDVEDALSYLYSSGYLSSDTDYDAALLYAVENAILHVKITELGFDSFTAEELADIETTAGTVWETALDEYVAYFLSEDTEEARAQTRAAGEEYYKNLGYDPDMLLQNEKDSRAFERLTAYLQEGLTITEEEIQQVFDENVAMYQSTFEGNVPYYEYMTKYYGQESWYMPEGYRGVTHILITPDETLLNEYVTLKTTLEEQLSAAEETAEPAEETAEPAAAGDGAADDAEPAEPVATAEPVTQAQVDAARQAVLDSVKDKTDDIYARLAKGEAFNDLIAEYGEDGGMKDEATLAEGYPVHMQSIGYVEGFVEGAFSSAMQKVGDTSDPVLTEYGVYILHYLRDIPGGAVELSADIRDLINEYLLSVKTNEKLTELLDTWKAEMTIVYNQEAIDAVKAAAQAEAPADDAAPADDTEPTDDTEPADDADTEPAQ